MHKCMHGAAERTEHEVDTLHAWCCRAYIHSKSEGSTPRRKSMAFTRFTQVGSKQILRSQIGPLSLEREVGRSLIEGQKRNDQSTVESVR